MKSDQMGVLYWRIAKLCKKAIKGNLMRHERIHYDGVPTFKYQEIKNFGALNPSKMKVRWRCHFRQGNNMPEMFYCGVNYEDGNYYIVGGYTCDRTQNDEDVKVHYEYSRELADPRSIPNLIKFAKMAKRNSKGCNCKIGAHIKDKGNNYYYLPKTFRVR